MTSDNDIALSCKGLWKVFGDEVLRDLPVNDMPAGEEGQKFCSDIRARKGIVACGDIDLEIRRGEFFVLMGLSGSGKSTLMRCMARLSDPTAGALELDGKDFLNITDKELMDIRRRKIGMVFQHFGLFPHMTVLENVAFPLKVQNIAQAEREAKATEMIKLVGLEGRDGAYPHQLSGGQKQRVGIARSLAVEPELWFLDEPFSALDPLIRWQMQSELLRLQTMFHKTIIFVTHDFMEAVRLADRIAIMKDGVLVQVGTPEDIVLNPADDYVAEFVKEAPRTKIIKIEQLMDSSPEAIARAGDEKGVDATMTIEHALSWSAERGGEVPVSDTTGKVIGMVSPDRLAAALRGE